MSNYRICGASHRGKSHESSGTVCQDAHFYLVRPGFIIAAVADGLGSSKHSDVASKIAARGTVDYCAGKINGRMKENEILPVIKSAFDHVDFAIKQTAGDDLDDYDTTLTLAVFIQDDLYYGHAGDSGIIALRSDGIFEEVTEQQLGSGHGKERPVYPLAARSNWVFGRYGHKTRAIFLMTDGIINKAVPPLLENQRYKLDNAYLYYLYHNLCKKTDIDEWINDSLSRVLPQEVNYDDKTLVAVVCGTAKIKLQPKEYYEFPDEDEWNALREEQKKQLYPYKYPSSEPDGPGKPDGPNKPDGSKNRVSGKVIAALAIAFAVTVSGIFYYTTDGFDFRPPEIKVLEAIDNGDYTEAYDLYTEKVLGDPQAERFVNTVLTEKIEDAYKKFNNGTITFDRAMAVIGLVENSRILDTEELRQVISDISLLKKSKDFFILAEEEMKNRNFEKAFTFFGYVIEADSNYETAQIERESARKKIILQYLPEIEEKIDAGDYEGAEALINSTIKFFGEDESLTRALERILTLESDEE